MARKGRRTFGATRQRASGKWQASFKAPDGKRYNAPNTFVTDKDAHLWLGKVERTISDGTYPTHELLGWEVATDDDPLTFGEYVERWLAQRVDLRPRTRELYESLWRLWLKADMATVALESMTPETWRTWFTRQKVEHPTSTQPAKAYRMARAVCNTAVEDGLLTSNPVKVKNAGRENTAERPVLTEDQVAAIARAIEPQYRLMVLLASYQCLRFGELAGLRRRRVDLLHKVIKIEEQAVELKGGKVVTGPPKSDAGRRDLPIPPKMVGLLEWHLGEHVGAKADALLFTNSVGGSLRRSGWHVLWTAACTKAGVSGVHFHDLRHSGLTWAAQDGATTAELMQLAGHSSARAAMIYQHATDERKRALAERMSDRMPSLDLTKPTEAASGG